MVGSGVESSTVLLGPVCTQNEIDGAPAADQVTTQCGEWTVYDITTEAPGTNLNKNNHEQDISKLPAFQNVTNQSNSRKIAKSQLAQQWTQTPPLTKQPE